MHWSAVYWYKGSPFLVNELFCHVRYLESSYLRDISSFNFTSKSGNSYSDVIAELLLSRQIKQNSYPDVKFLPCVVTSNTWNLAVDVISGHVVSRQTPEI